MGAGFATGELYITSSKRWPRGPVWKTCCFLIHTLPEVLSPLHQDHLGCLEDGKIISYKVIVQLAERHTQDPRGLQKTEAPPGSETPGPLPFLPGREVSMLSKIVQVRG